MSVECGKAVTPCSVTSTFHRYRLLDPHGRRQQTCGNHVLLPVVESCSILRLAVSTSSVCLEVTEELYLPAQLQRSRMYVMDTVSQLEVSSWLCSYEDS